MEHIRTRDVATDERGLLATSIARLVIVFLLIAIPLYDGGSMLVNLFTLDSTADEIAVQLTTGLAPSQMNIGTLEPRAKELAAASGARLVGLTIEGNVVKVTIRRRASTLLVGRVGPIKDWARATATGQAGVV
jgi:hypothetical protein